MVSDAKDRSLREPTPPMFYAAQTQFDHFVHIAELVGGQTLILIAVGAAAGLGFTLIAAPALRSLLYGISPEDPKSLAASILFVTLTVALATLFPVIRAIRTEPAQTLREEN